MRQTLARKTGSGEGEVTCMNMLLFVSIWKVLQPAERGGRGQAEEGVHWKRNTAFQRATMLFNYASVDATVKLFKNIIVFCSVTARTEILYLQIYISC